MKKKVLISILQVFKSAAGASRNTHEQIRYFVSKGHEVHVVADKIDADQVKKSGGIAHKTLPWINTGAFRRKWYDFHTRRLINKIKPDLIIGHGDLQNQDVLCLHNSVHLASELIHGKELPANAEMFKIHTPILREKKFKHIIANSNLMKNDLHKRFDIPLKDITVVYPAYDEKKFFPLSDDERAVKRREYGLDEEDICLGLITSGNFKKRGVDLFIKALKDLSPQITGNLKVWIVGKDKPLIHDTSVEIEFKPVIENVEDYYHCLDLFVLPARIEEFGRVLLEAMACGCPVLTTKNVGAAELIQGRARELIIADLTAKNLKEKIEHFLNISNAYPELRELSLTSSSPCSEAKLPPLFDEVFSTYL